MKHLPNEARRNRRIAMDAALLFLVVLLVTQMWLLTATLESYLAGHTDAALPGLLVSAVLFLGCFVIYRFVVQLDRAPHPEDRGSTVGPWEIH